MTEITLDHPIEINGNFVKTIPIRPATKADFAKIYSLNASAATKSSRLLALLTGRHWRDLAAIEARNPGTMERLAATIDHEGL